ncbi:MAG: NAD-glutamate dehydrogenase [Porphyrobacter sp.]|nr:NAD-glutamate dehydrogenase [Porphyrobacter sp.]
MGSKTAAGAAHHALIKALRLHLEASLLPGDGPADKATLDDAAQFLLAAAGPRGQGESLVHIASDTGERRLRIAVINDDMPFLVDSVAATIAAQGLAIDRLLHPVAPVTRDAAGAIIALGKPGAKDAAGARESLIYVETPRADARQRRELLEALNTTLADVRAAVGDWSAMQAVMGEDAARAAALDPEAGALLAWLNGGMLTQLGHLTRYRDKREDALLGICRGSARELLAESSIARAFEWFDRHEAEGRPRTLLVIKANVQSRVHRASPLDLFVVPVRENGAITGLSIHAGLWTSAALNARPGEVPVLRRALADLTAELGYDPAGHNGKALVHAFTSLPNDLLIAFGASRIAELATTKMALIDRPRPRLVMLPGTLERHVFAFVWLPRDQLSTDVRLRVQAMLLATPGAALLDWSLEVEGSNLALLRFLIDVRACERLPDPAGIEAQLVDMLRGWNEAVETHLAAGEDDGRAAMLAARYAPAFPTGYRLSYGPAEAARDIAKLRTLALADSDDTHPAADRATRLYRMDSDGAEALRLKIYVGRGRLALSDAVPALEHFGFRVTAEIPTFLTDPALGSIHDFLLAVPAGFDAGALLARATLIEDALADVLNGVAEDDPFNRLIAAIGLTPREANWLRAIYRYLRQTGVSYTIYTVVDALAGAAPVTRAMIDLLTARHDPAFAGSREEAIAAAQTAFTRGLAKVTAINDDRLLRLYRAVIDAVLRTNAFAPASTEALAFKIDSSLVPNLPKPVPWREIFVYSARVEGIHLRSGAVARGGLRWSDRRDDFRTEILGLMKAQRVKNAVIVPTGAKGGFYPKQLPSPALDREGWAAEGRASYEIFIRTLLSVTDNIVEGRVVHPEGVQVLDGEDPYFVVAADKGTATFSDVANGIAQSRDFWLDDAFASGGSNGYDHKAMGITARGAWVSVQRHFREMGIDVQKDSITVAGCGDMSGDVFGNGMLLSKAVLLVAAFDHRHIFLDPSPDPLASWKERKRLFELPRSSWEDYNPALISKGGGVFSRALKRIKLTRQVRDLLGIADKEIEPEALISAILRARVDLLWFGGIGTYVKAGHENNIQVGDPANDTIRIDAEEVGARVIGEGANLGVTQAARIAFSLKGGRINTDFIDNSAGVDCSDNEVNIKIALAAALRDGKLSGKKRNTLLAAMTDEVGQIVLEDNRLQALALSVAETGGPGASASYVRLIERLEEVSDFDRRTEGLADGETLLRRAADGHGLTRPELAVLLSSAKLALQEAIEASALADDPVLEGMLIARFPTAMRKTYAAQIRTHRLRREMIATSLANRIVNRIGMVHPFELAEEEGVGLAEVAGAFVVAERLFGLDALWRELDEAAIPEAARLALFDRLAAAVGNLMSDVLRTASGKVAAGAMIESLSSAVTVLVAGREELLTAEPRARSLALRDSFVALGASEVLAARVANLFDFDGAVGLAQTARDTGIDAKLLTHAFTGIGTRLGLDWAQGTAAHMSPSDVWERLLVSGLARDFQQMRMEFLRRLMRTKAGKSDPLAAVNDWAARNDTGVSQFRAMIARAQARPPVGAAMLAQIASQARNLLER